MYLTDSILNSTAFIFDPFTAQIGPGIAVTEGRKNCQINLDIRYPATLQYGAASTTYTGMADLDDDVSGAITSTYYFTGSKFFTVSEHLSTLQLNRK
jgi:hypothetical protein